MKRIWSILLTMTVALTLLCPMTAYAATGEGNIDGGGGNLGDATSHGSWNPGNEGVRVTIVRSDDHAVVSTPIDLTNRAPAASIYHFGKVSKLQYTNGVALSPVQGSYTCIKPTQAVPRIISTNGRNNIEAIKSYFTDEQVIRAIANYSGMDFDTLIGGEYKILLEPIAYVPGNAGSWLSGMVRSDQQKRLQCGYQVFAWAWYRAVRGAAGGSRHHHL